MKNYYKTLTVSLAFVLALVLFIESDVLAVDPPLGSFSVQYYDNEDFTNLKISRNENQINFAWGTGSPDPTIAPDTFSAIWEGEFIFEQGDYVFTVTVDDGVKLYIDGTPILEKWFIQPDTTYSARCNLTAGSHLVKMEYFEHDGGATAKLSWTHLITLTAGPLPFAKGEHPRILITKDDIPALAAKVDEPTDPLYPRYMLMKNDVDAVILNSWESIGGPSSLTAQEKVVSAAFVYLIENYLHPENSNFYVDRVKQVLESTDPNWYIGYSEHLYSFAVAYDWIYNGLSPQDRITLGNKLMTSYALLQNPTNPAEAGSLDSWHVMLSNRPSGEWVYAAIAIWNETDLDGNADNSLAQTKLNQIKTFLVTQKIPFTNMVGGGINPDGGYDSIGGTRQFALELCAWDKATGEDLWNTSRYLRDNIITRLFAWKMYASMWVPFGNFSHWLTDKAFTAYYPIEILSKKDTTGVAQYVANDLFVKGIDPHLSWYEHWEQYRWVIFYDPTKPATNYNTLPLARYEQGYNDGGTAPIEGLDAGWVFFRSGWTKDDTLIAFTSGDWFTPKQTYNVNAFSIYRSGDLATMNNGNKITGAKAGANVSFQMNYGDPTIAVNSITVSDPDIAMDQGQEYYQNYSRSPDDPTPGYFDPDDWRNYCYPFDLVNTSLSDHYKGAKYYDRGDIIKFETNANYDYAVGDGTNAYHPDRLTNFQRALAFLEKKYLVILDRVTATKPEFVKRWYLHTIKEPIIPGASLTNTSSTDGSTTWSQTDFNNLYVDSDPSGGRLFVKSLLPKDATYRKRGGEGFFFWRNDRSWNPEPGSAADGSPDAPFFEGRKGWRLEQDVSGRANDIFLNVLYPTDDTVTSMPETVSISQADGNTKTDKVVGAHIKDSAENKVILFSSDPKGAAISGDITYTVKLTSEKPPKEFIFDLDPTKNYNITSGGTAARVRNFIFDTDPALDYDINSESSETTLTVTVVPGSGILSPGVEVVEHTDEGTLVFTVEVTPPNPMYCSIKALGLENPVDITE